MLFECTSLAHSSTLHLEIGEFNNHVFQKRQRPIDQVTKSFMPKLTKIVIASQQGILLHGICKQSVKATLSNSSCQDSTKIRAMAFDDHSLIIKLSFAFQIY
jgi:hypothetical protein